MHLDDKRSITIHLSKSENYGFNINNSYLNSFECHSLSNLKYYLSDPLGVYKNCTGSITIHNFLPEIPISNPENYGFNTNIGLF